MELRRYFQVLLRYWPAVVILTLVGLIAAGQYYISNKPTWQAVVVVGVVQVPSPNDTYSAFYANQASEYAADDLSKIIPGAKFMAVVANQLQEGGINLPPDQLKGMVTIERKHRELTITTSSPDQNTAQQFARAIGAVLESDVNSFMAPRQLTVQVVDITSQASLSGGRTWLLTAVRVVAGLLAGIGLAFLLAYLDNAIRTKAEAEEVLGLPVLAVIPSYRRSGGKGPRPRRWSEADAQIISKWLESIASEEGPDKEKITTR